MATDDRVEKRQARQRGAWRDNARELKDADFSFKFGGTPSTAGRNNKTSAITPAAASFRATTSRSRSQGSSIPRTTTKEPVEREPPVSASSASHSSTRPLVTPVQRSTKRKRNGDIDQEIDELAELIPSTRTSSKQRRLTIEESESLAILEEDELNQESPDHDESALNSRTKQRRISEEIENTPPQQAVISKASKPRRTTFDKVRPPLVGIDQNSVTVVPVVEDDSTQPKLTKRGRVHDTNESMSRRSTSKLITQKGRPDRKSLQRQQEVAVDDEADEIATSQVVQQQRAPNKGSDLQADREPARNAKRQSDTRKRRSTKPSRKSSSTTSDATVPIRVYRPSQKPLADADPLGSVPIPSMNPSDVLAQCLSELCKLHLQKMKQKEGISGRKLVTILGFKNAIQDSLFDVSVAQNSVYALAGRLRKVKREQGDLRSELMRIKARREEVVLRMDSVRSHYLSRSKEETANRQMLRDLQDLRTASKQYSQSLSSMSEDDSNEQQHISILLQDAKALVARGGILQTVQSWNSSMETLLKAI